MKTSLLFACRLLLVGLALAGCKREVITKGSGDAPESMAVPGSTGPRVRTALVIGNSHYKNLQRLDACKHDAEVMAATFQKIGITLHGGKPLFDLTADEMDAAISSFARSLGRDSEAFIYYSGHGAQIGGGNYLLPVNFDAQYENQAKRQAISLDAILETLEKTDSQLRVVILDACRDPGEFLPGEPTLKGPAHAKGLSEQRVDAPETLVCFATKHGTAALADDTSSYYSRVLAEEIVKPGKVEDVMKLVARRVFAETDKKQLPFTYGSLLQDHYFVAPMETPRPQPVVAQPTIPTATPEPVQMAKLAPALLNTAKPTTSSIDSKDVIITMDNREVAGKVIGVSPSGPILEFQVGQGRLGLPLSSVKEVRMTPPADYDEAIMASEAKDYTKARSLIKGVVARYKGMPSPWVRKATLMLSVLDSTIDAPFANSLGMKFVPVPGTSVLFSIWDTRVQDYREYALTEKVEVQKPDFEQGPTHPVVNVNWKDAQAFCEWLSQKEGRTYRLPTDAEWSAAVGLGAEQGSTPEEKNKNGAEDVYPWGRQWPPPEGAGNYDASLKVDSYANTSPVGSFAANRHGLYDMGGNVWQWCEDWYNAAQDHRVMRGGAWGNAAEFDLRSSSRGYDRPTRRFDYYGFRCVLVVSGG